MIKQFALYPSKNALDSDIQKIINYPGINIIANKNSHRYVILFEHEKELKKKDFNISDKWIIDINNKYKVCF